MSQERFLLFQPPVVWRTLNASSGFAPRGTRGLSEGSIGAGLGWLVRGGPMSSMDDLVMAAQDCHDDPDYGYYGISTWGLPGDTIEQAAARLPGSWAVIRPVPRKDLMAAGYRLVTARNGHCSVVMDDEPTIADCQSLAALFMPAIRNPARVARHGNKGSPR